MRTGMSEEDKNKTEGDTGRKMGCPKKSFWKKTCKYFLNINSLGSCVIFTEPKILCEVGAEAKEDEAVGGQDRDHLTFFPELSETPPVTEDQQSPLTPTSCSNARDCPEIRIILQELHPQEEVLFSSTEGCVVVSRQKSSGTNAQLVIYTIIII